MAKDGFTPDSEPSDTASPLKPPARRSRKGKLSQSQSKTNKRKSDKKEPEKITVRKPRKRPFADILAEHVQARHAAKSSPAKRLPSRLTGPSVGQSRAVKLKPGRTHARAEIAHGLKEIPRQKELSETDREILAAVDEIQSKRALTASIQTLEITEHLQYSEVFPSERKDEGRLNETLLHYLKDKNLPRNLWPKAAAEIERLIARLVTPTLKDRPLWDDRAKYPELANLSAPEFLKRVWADQIAQDGSIEKALVRQNDKSLMAKVDNYVATRQRRRQDAGDAKGLHLIAQRTRPAGPR